MNKKKLAWQLPFLAILIIGTIIILKKQAPFRTDEGFVFGTVYKITYQSEDNLKEEIETEIIRSGDLVIDVVHNMIFKKGRELSIKDTEFRLCYMLVRNDGRIMPRELLLERFWDMDVHCIEYITL